MSGCYGHAAAAPSYRIFAVAVSVFVVNPEPPNSPIIFPMNKY
jgi:hypothetical protein